MKHELALFHPGATEKAVTEIIWINYRPSTQINNSGPLEFVISGTSSDYVLLSKTRLHVKVKIKKADGDDVTDADNVALVNLSLHSLFRQVDISLNQTIITSTVGVNYPYKALIDCLLSYNNTEAVSQLQLEGFYKDVRYYMDDVTLNSGHVQRKSLTMHGIVDFEGPLHIDVAQQPKLIPNGVEIAVKLFQSGDAFRLLSAGGTTYSVEIVDAILKVCHVKVRPSVLLAQNQILLKTPALYPFWKSDIKTYTIAEGFDTFSIDDMYHGQVPARLYVGLTSNAAYSGDFAKNPFNFWHYFLTRLEFTIEGVSRPTVAFTPTFRNISETSTEVVPSGYMPEYLSLFQNRYPQQQGKFIERADYPGGYALYCFDLKSGTGGQLFSTSETGHTRLTAAFGQPLPHPVTLIAYAVYPSMFKIDHSRNVLI